MTPTTSPCSNGAMHRNLLAAVALLVASVASPAKASVSDAPNYIIGSVAIGVPYLAISAVLIGEGLDDALSRGHGLAEEGAVLEIVWASLHLSAGVGMLIAAGVACGDGCSIDGQLAALVGVGATLAAVGAAYLAHGIWSLSDGRPPPPVTPTVVPLESGALATARFVF